MKIEVKKFGEILSSRPAGREACLVAKAYLKPATKNEKIELDFEGVKVLTPSWADEFIAGLQEEYGDRLIIRSSNNSSVQESLQIIERGKETGYVANDGRKICFGDRVEFIEQDIKTDGIVSRNLHRDVVIRRRVSGDTMTLTVPLEEMIQAGIQLKIIKTYQEIDEELGFS